MTVHFPAFTLQLSVRLIKMSMDKKTLQKVQSNPFPGKRNIARHLRVPKRDLHAEDMYPYHGQRALRLGHEDFAQRLEFCD
jgi:hypothetical protein